MESTQNLGAGAPHAKRASRQARLTPSTPIPNIHALLRTPRQVMGVRGKVKLDTLHLLPFYTHINTHIQYIYPYVSS